MNREIKFRVWNGLEMVYDVISGRFGTFYVNPDNNGIDQNDSASLSPYNTKYHDNVWCYVPFGITKHRTINLQ